MNRLSEIVITGLTFLAFVAVGLSVYSDYGVSWDEHTQMAYGKMVFDRVFHGTPLPENEPLAHYGPFFNLLAQVVFEALGLSDPRDMLLTKHLLTFLFFALSVAFFYLMCRNHFRSWVPAYIAAIFLAVHPRIFANSFYNPKDLPFLASFITACFTMQWFLRRPGWPRAVIHGITSAICVDIRVLGVLTPFMTVIFMAADLWVPREDKPGLRSVVLGLVTYLVSASAFTVAFWPYLWPAPLNQFVETFRLMSRFPYGRTVLYLGELISSRTLPWHYAPVWVAITTPVSIIALFLVGLADLPRLIRDFLTRRAGFPTLKLMPYVWLGAPLCAVVVFHSELYNGWRQLYFVYPALVMIAVAGLVRIAGLFDPATLFRPRNALVALIAVVLCVDLVGAVHFSIRSHPNQYVYFNPIIGGLKGAKGRFEWDYYGVSLRQLLEDIAQAPKVSPPIMVAGGAPLSTILIFPPAERAIFVPYNVGRYTNPDKIHSDSAYYRIATLRGGVESWRTTCPRVHEVRVDGETISAAWYMRGSGG